MLTILFLFLREREELSAVCVFSLSDISKVLDGPFKELKKTCENWINPEPVPTPRPGQVLNHITTACTITPSIQCLHYILLYSNKLLKHNFFFSFLEHFVVFEQRFEG